MPSNQRLERAVRAKEARCARRVIVRAQRADTLGPRPLKLFVRARERRILVLKR
jgi:hypothetical protein